MSDDNGLQDQPDPPTTQPEASIEVVREMTDPPAASVESVRASEPPRSSIETVRNDPHLPSSLRDDDPPKPSTEPEKKGL